MFSLSLLGTIFLLGFRHGFDLDHIAAISDIVSQTKDNKKSFINGFIYILAHGLIVILLGFSIITLGISLPLWVDELMGKVVGITLIILGIWIIFSVLVKKEKFKFISKWMLIFKGAFHIYNHIFRIKNHHPVVYPKSMGMRSSFILGILHGIGAETPTQLLLFVTAAGIGGFGGNLLFIVFIIGLLASNLLVLLFALLGFTSIKRYNLIYLTLGFITGVISLIVGTMILFNMI